MALPSRPIFRTRGTQSSCFSLFALLTAAQRGLSSLQLQPGLCKKGTDQMRLLSEAPDGEIELLVQLVQVSAHQVAHLDILQVMPSPLNPGVQVGGIARQG